MKTLIILLFPVLTFAQSYTYTRQIYRTGNDKVFHDTITVVLSDSFLRINKDCYQVNKVSKNTYYLNEKAKFRLTQNGAFFTSPFFSWYFDRKIKKTCQN